MNDRIAAWAMWALLGVAGCGDTTSETHAGSAASSRGAVGVLATVNGAAIRAADVEQTARMAEVDAKRALQLLIDEALLASESERRGLHRSSPVVLATRQASVQALLTHEVERTGVDEAAIDKALAEQHARFNVPERRRSLHVLVVVERSEPSARQEAAQALSARILAELASSPEPRAVWGRYKHSGSIDGFKITAEELPLVSARDAYAPEYLQGLFSRSSVGVVEQPWHSDFGWHAIVVTEIAAASSQPVEQARATVRDELTVAARKAALEGLLEDVRQRHVVVPNQAAMDETFRRLSADGTAHP